jgi:Delta3-Delta2-enoyl-CoA isomerase
MAPNRTVSMCGRCRDDVEISRACQDRAVNDAPVRVGPTTNAHVIRLERDGNLFDEAFLASFHDALDTIEAARDGLPIITVGSGKSFSSGFDLDYLGSLQGDALWEFVERACRLVARILVFGAPTVAAVNGHAFGIGGILTLAHDLRVMREDRGWFCLPEVDLGLAFHPFMLALITARLPAGTAAEAILTGRRYDAATAQAAGIVHGTAAMEDLVAQAAVLAQPWAGKRPDVVAILKRQLHGAVLATLDSAS